MPDAVSALIQHRARQSRPLGDSVPGLAPPAPTPGSFTQPVGNEQIQCRAQRVSLAGGALNTVLTDEATEPFEQLYRRLPEQGIHSPLLSPNNPFIFELGSFQVPKQMALIVFDLRPDIYRFSGIDPNDFLPVENRRFSGQIGYEISIDGNRPGNLRYELEPIPRQVEPSQFLPRGDDQIDNPGFLSPDTAFRQARSNSFGSASGAGLALLPQRPFRYGPATLPLSLVVNEGQSIAFKAVFFKPVLSPLAFLEWDMAGVLVPRNLLTELMQCVKPK